MLVQLGAQSGEEGCVADVITEKDVVRVTLLRCRDDESPVSAIRSLGIGADAEADVIRHPGDAHDD